jgi:hypothetical protein
MKNSVSIIVALASAAGGCALAGDVNVDIEIGQRPRVVEVQPAPVIERVWIPDRIVKKTETVMVSPPHREKHVETVCVAPAHTERQEMKVLVAPARIECVKEKVLVHPARVERQWVPASASGEAKIGPVTIRGSTDDGYWRDVVIPAEYQVVERRVEIPAKYEIVARDVEIPARYERVVKEVEIPARYDEVTREIVVPGHYEDRTVVPPPTVVVEPRRPLIDIDLDFGKKKKHDKDRDD